MLSILLAIATGQPVSLTAVRDAYPHLSPDGRTVVFHSNRSGDQAIWTADAGGVAADVAAIGRHAVDIDPLLRPVGLEVRRGSRRIIRYPAGRARPPATHPRSVEGSAKL